MFTCFFFVILSQFLCAKFLVRKLACIIFFTFKMSECHVSRITYCVSRFACHLLKDIAILIWFEPPIIGLKLQQCKVVNLKWVCFAYFWVALEKICYQRGYLVYYDYAYIAICDLKCVVFSFVYLLKWVGGHTEKPACYFLVGILFGVKLSNWVLRAPSSKGTDTQT